MKNYCEVIESKKRSDGIKEAIEKKFNSVVLDDGYQDFEIKKNLNIVCFNHRTKIGNGQVIPAGPLRENLNSLKNCDIILLSGNKDFEFEMVLKKYNKNLNFFYYNYKAENIDQFNLAEFSISVRSKNSTTVLIKETTIYAKLYIPPDLVAPATYAMCPELVNSPSFDISWNVESWYKENLESGNDTKYVIIEYSTDNGTNGETWSDWEIWSNISSRMGSTKFTEAKHNHQYRFRSVGGDDDGKIEDKERVTRMMANDKIKHLDYDKAIEIYESIGDKEAAKNARKLKAEQGSVKVDQTVVQGDQITKTEIKDSVLNRSNVGGGGSSKAEELREAKALLDERVIDDDEFKQMKKEILGK
mgnify:CR=1 FL=1